MTLVSLGRYGDLINILPLLWLRRENSNRLVVSRRFADLLEGVSYVQPVPVPFDPIQLEDAAMFARARFPDVVVSQVFRNRDGRHLTPDFAQEAWRLASSLSDWNTAPTVFDRRNRDRETLLPIPEEPFVAFAGHGVSSPYAEAPALLSALRRHFSVLDLSQIRAEKPFDLLGILDRAQALVTVDTMHLWLSRASTCPVVSLVNDEPWLASPPPPQCVVRSAYRDASPGRVVNALRYVLRPLGKTILVVDKHGTTPRHKRAQATWKPDVLIHRSFGRFPSMREMLGEAMRYVTGNDCIVWTNDDVALHDLTPLHAHVSKFGAVSVRRHVGHIGRELFAFSADWLRDRMHDLPDVVTAAPYFDLVLACWIRKANGYGTTQKNLQDDLFPSELPPGVCTHEEHPSSWTLDTPAAEKNKKILNGFMQPLS